LSTFNWLMVDRLAMMMIFQWTNHLRYNMSNNIWYIICWHQSKRNLKTSISYIKQNRKIVNFKLWLFIDGGQSKQYLSQITFNYQFRNPVFE
jgi:hypothetical protein